METLWKNSMGSIMLNLKDGILDFGRYFTGEELFKIYQKFSADLLDAKIPNNRVIGFLHDWDVNHSKSVFRNNDIYGQSLIELSMKMTDIIVEEIGGNDPEKGCFYGSEEEVENDERVERYYGIAGKDLSGKIIKKANIFTKDTRENIGALMCGTVMPPDSHYEEKMTTDNITYFQFDTYSQPVYPRTLIKGVDICTFDTDEQIVAEPRIIMFIKEGKGRMSFRDTQRLVSDKEEKFFSCPTTYDLSKYFTIKTPDKNGGSYLELCYAGYDIDEDVLLSILMKYAGSVEI